MTSRRKKAQTLRSINRLLSDYYNDMEIREWWDAPHTRFGGLSAQQMVDAGREQEVLQDLRQLDEAVYI